MKENRSFMFFHFWKQNITLGTPPTHMEQLEPDCAASFHDNNFGDFTSGVGSYLQQSTD